MHLDTNKSLECTYEQAVSVSKVRYQHGCAIDPTTTRLVNDVCTPYAADLIMKQLSVAYQFTQTATVNIVESEAFVSFDGTNFCAVDCSRMVCNCVFNNTTKLPCKHVFVYRAQSQMSMFTADLIAQRWRKPVIASTATPTTSQCEAFAFTTPRTDILSKTDKTDWLLMSQNS